MEDSLGTKLSRGQEHHLAVAIMAIFKLLRVDHRDYEPEYNLDMK